MFRVPLLLLKYSINQKYHTIIIYRRPYHAHFNKQIKQFVVVWMRYTNISLIFFKLIKSHILLVILLGNFQIAGRK